MKKILTLLAAVILMAVTSCEKIYIKSEDLQEQDSLYTLTVHFAHFEVQEMTRSAISEYATRLDIFFVDNNGQVSEYHQASTDTGFGTLSVVLNNTKTYNLVAVAHKGASAADYDNETDIITFPDNKVTHSFIYADEITPTQNMELDCEMTRIVAQLKLETTDAIPDDVKKMRITVNNVFDQWNVTTGGTHQLNRVSTVNVGSKNNDGTAAFNVYEIVTTSQTLHTVTVEALTENDDVVQSRTFENVPLRNGYRTIARGNFFTDAQSSVTFTADDWIGDTNYNF